VAVGATVQVLVKSNCGDDPACANRVVHIDETRVDDATVFSVDNPVNKGLTVTITALRVGETTVHARASDGQGTASISAAVRAELPNRITLGPPWNCESDPVALVGTNAPFAVDSRRFFNDIELRGAGGPFPLTSDVAVRDSTNGLFFTAQAIRGTGVVRSLLEPPVKSVDVRVFDIFQVTSMTLTAVRPPGFSPSLSLHSDVFVDGKSVCADVFARTVSTTTPKICEPRDPPIAIGHAVELTVLSRGVCAVKVALDGSTATSEGTFEVMR